MERVGNSCRPRLGYEDLLRHEGILRYKDLLRYGNLPRYKGLLRYEDLLRYERGLLGYEDLLGYERGLLRSEDLSGLLREMGLATLSCLEGFSRRRDAFARFIERVLKRAPVFSLRPCGYDLERSKSFSEEVVAMCYSYRDYRKEEEARRKREEELRRRREEQEARRVEKKEPARRERVLVRS